MTDFSTGAKAVQDRLDTMTDKFAGKKLIQDATLAAQAIADIGGASRLTQKELEQVGNQARAALDKMRLLGLEPPANLLKIADAGKQAGGAFDGLKGSVVGSLVGFVSAQAIIHATEAAFHALTGAVSSFGAMIIGGARVADVEDNFKRLTEQTGRLGTTLLTTLKAGTHNTITDFELMKTANQDLTAGLNLTDAQFGTLAKGAFALAQATGGSVADGLKTMNDAMLTGRTRALALLTGKIDLKAAEEKYAESLGASRSNLTDSGKLEAARAAILDAVTEATKRLGEQTDGMDELADQASTAWANFKDELGKTIATSDVLLTGLTGLGQALSDTFGSSQHALIQAIAGAVDDAAIGMVGFGESAVQVGGFIVKEWYAIEKIVGDVAQVIEIAALANDKLSQAQASTYAKITFGDTSKKFAADAAAFQASIDAHTASILKRGDALKADDKAQAEIDTTTQKYVATLEALRVKMAAIRDGHKDGAAVGLSPAAINQSGAALGNATGKLLDFSKEEAAAEKAAERAAKAQLKFTESVRSLTSSSVGAVKGLGQFGILFKENEGRGQDFANVLEGLNQDGTLLSTTFRDFGDKLQKVGTIQGVHQKQIEKIRGGTEEWRTDLDHLASTMTQFAQIAGDSFGGVVKDIANIVVSFNAASKAATTFNDVNATGSERAIAGLQAVLAVTQAIDQATRSRAETTVDRNNGTIRVDEHRAATAASGALAGATTGAALGPWGALAGGAIGAIVGWYRSGQAAKEVNKVRQAFVDSSGGLDQLNKHAHDAGTTLDAFLKAKTPEEYNKAITDLTATMEKHDKAVKRVADGVTGLQDAWNKAGDYIPADIRGMITELQGMNGLTSDQTKLLGDMATAAEPNYKKLTDLAATYGITLEGLGPRFQQESITAKAEQIFKDFSALRDAGADVGGVLLGMSGAADVAAIALANADGKTSDAQKALEHFGGSISGLVQDSIRFGTAIPENLKPLIENLIAAGKLTDENGEKLTDITKINFGATPLDKSTNAIVDAVHELRDALLGLPDAAARAAAGVQGAFDHIHINQPPAPNRTLSEDQPMSFANGSRGRVLNFGTGTLAILHGHERVQTAGEVTRSGSSDLSGMQEQLEDLNRYLTQDFAREVSGLLKKRVA